MKLLLFTLTLLTIFNGYSQKPDEIQKTVNDYITSQAAGTPPSLPVTRPAVTVTPIVPKIITDPLVFKNAPNTSVVKKEVSENFFKITYHSSNSKNLSGLIQNVENKGLTESIVGEPTPEQKHHARIMEVIGEMQTKKNKGTLETDEENEYYARVYHLLLIDPTDDSKNFFIYQVPAIPGKPIRVRTINTWQRPYISAMTVPFKIREKEENVPAQAKGDIKNLGLYFSYGLKYEKLFFDNTTSTTKWSLGLFVAPSVEELNSANTRGEITTSTTKVYLSSAIALSVSYNAITVAFIPLGYDYGVNSVQKKWIYDGQPWWGFGIGIDTKLFGF